MHCLQHLALPFTLVYETDIEKPLVVVHIGRPQPTGTTAALPDANRSHSKKTAISYQTTLWLSDQSKIINEVYQPYTTLPKKSAYNWPRVQKYFLSSIAISCIANYYLAGNFLNARP